MHMEGRLALIIVFIFFNIFQFIFWVVLGSVAAGSVFLVAQMVLARLMDSGRRAPTCFDP